MNLVDSNYLGLAEREIEKETLQILLAIRFCPLLLFNVEAVIPGRLRVF